MLRRERAGLPTRKTRPGSNSDEVAANVELVLAFYRTIDGDPVLPVTRRLVSSLDFVRHIVQHIRAQRPRRIIDCEGGISTIAMAYAAQHIPGTHIWSICSNPQIAMDLRGELEQRGLSDRATIIAAPLVERDYPGAIKHGHWYDLPSDALPESPDMLVIGEAFGEHQRHARYPIGAELLPKMAHTAHIFLAPGLHDDEQRLASLWRGVVPDLGVRELGASGGREMFYLDHKMTEVIADFESRAETH